MNLFDKSNNNCELKKNFLICETTVILKISQFLKGEKFMIQNFLSQTML